VKAQKFSALVLAGDREPGDPIAVQTGSGSKAIAPIAGIPMAMRVIDALSTSTGIDSICLCGPSREVLQECPPLLERVDSGTINWFPARSSPCDSVEFCLQRMDKNTPVLLTTADHALLTTEIIDYFTGEAMKQQTDVVVALLNHRLISETFPSSRRTRYRFRDGHYCGCNLFAFMSERGMEMIRIWKTVEANRKHPIRILAHLLGWPALLQYLLGRLTLKKALATLSSRIDIDIAEVSLPFPRAGIDVDSLEDFHLVESILTGDSASR